MVVPLVTQKKGCNNCKIPEGCPVLISPLPGSTGVPQDKSLIWAAPDPKPDGYKLWVGSSPGAADVIDTIDLGDRLIYQPDQPFPENTTLFVRIAAYNRCGDYTGDCTVFSFTTVSEGGDTERRPPGCTRLSFPAAGQQNVPLRPNLRWEAASGAPTGYRVRIAAGPNGEETLLNRDVGNTLNFTPPDPLPAGREISVTVLPYNQAGEASGCSSVRFTTADDTGGGAVPDCSTLLTPAVGDTEVSPNVILRWATVADATGYRLFAVNATTGAVVIPETDAGDFTDFAPEDPLPEGVIIELTIIPYNENGDAAGCSAQRFGTTGELPELYVRRSVTEMRPDDPVLETYRRAIRIMRDSLPQDHPHSWTQQALIHGGGRCRHGSWEFLPWHRAYLYYFEEVIREVTGDESFALPYWDWAEHPRVPEAFLEPPLDHDRAYEGRRTPWESVTNDEYMDEFIMATRVFRSFAGGPRGAPGLLEETPHNYVHSYLGEPRDLSDFSTVRDMGDTQRAGFDAIFYLHHANVDRLWVEWLERGNSNTDDPDWLNLTFGNHFYDRDGNNVLATIRDYTRTVPLGYRYDTQEEPTPAMALLPPVLPVNMEPIEGLEFEVALDEPLPLNQPVEIPFAINREMLDTLLVIADRGHEDRPASTAYAYFSNIVLPEDNNLVINVFINREDLRADTPLNVTESIGSGTFFLMRHEMEDGMEMDGMPGHKYDLLFDLTPTLIRLKEAGKLPGENLTIQLVAKPIGSGGGSTFNIGEATLFALKRKS